MTETMQHVLPADTCRDDACKQKSILRRAQKDDQSWNDQTKAQIFICFELTPTFERTKSSEEVVLPKQDRWAESYRSNQTIWDG